MSAQVDLVNEMVDMIVFGEPDLAVELAQEASVSLRRAAASHAQIVSYSNPDDPDVAEAIERVIDLLVAPPQSAQFQQAAASAKASAGMSTTTKVAIAAGGLAAVWFLFIRKK